MKLKYLIVLTILLYSITANSSIAQESEMGIEIGYGKTDFGNQYIKFIYPFDKDSPDYWRIGLKYYFHIPHSPLYVKSGLVWANRGVLDAHSVYFKLPLGLDLNFGRRVKFILGFGFYFSYLIYYDWETRVIENTHNRFQIGWQLNTGVGFQITEQFNVGIQYQSNFDLIPMYERRNGWGFSSYMLPYRGFDGFFAIVLKFRL